MEWPLSRGSEIHNKLVQGWIGKKIIQILYSDGSTYALSHGDSTHMQRKAENAFKTTMKPLKMGRFPISDPFSATVSIFKYLGHWTQLLGAQNDPYLIYS